MDVIMILRIVLGVFVLASGVYFIMDLAKHKEELKGGKPIALAIIGCITNLLDTWGIGSYATTQAGFKFTKSSEDITVPGTLNVGDTFPVTLEALLFFSFVDIDPLTLVLMIAAAIIGALIGAGVVMKWNLKMVRLGLGVGLLILAIVLFCKNAGLGPFAGADGGTLGLTGIKLIIGIVVNFFLGALMMIGVGLYAPCMALVSALGMNVGTAFPIMMGSCAFLMNAACFRFIKEGKYDRRAALYLAVFGCVGVVIAYKVACFFSLTVLTYIICVVMVYTSIMFFRDASRTQA